MLPPAAAKHDFSKITAVTAAADIEQANPECPYQDEAYFDVIMRVRRHPAGPTLPPFSQLSSAACAGRFPRCSVRELQQASFGRTANSSPA